MRLALIGFGQAGGKIVDRFVEFDNQTGSGFVRTAIAANTATADLQGLNHIPQEHRVLIGQSRVKGNGVGADNDLGAEIAERDIDELQEAIDHVPIHEVDAFLIVAALGGGTGSGGSPVLAKHLKHLYSEPVYGLGVLPASDEGGIYTLNAARSFQTFVRETDNLLVFDNDAWRKTGESLKDGYEAINEEIVKRFGVLFGAGEVRAGDEVGQNVVDSSEIINTLAGGGVSTLGYATSRVEEPDRGLLSRFKGTKLELDAAGPTNQLTSLTRKAALGRLTLPCEIGGTERSLLVASGPPGHLNRRGIERGRKWLEEQTGSMEVRGGDYPLPDEQHVAAAVLLSGVTNVPRIRQLQRVAIEARENIVAARSASQQGLNNLLADGSGELVPLF